jgi:flagellar biogenesis protein FliO
MKMVLSLAGILLLLVLGGYVIRRYLLDQTFLGKRNALMRVLARINITPKAGVALLEVPGKVLVVGITGNTLVALGELTTATSPPLQQPLAEPLPSFATTLDTSTASFADAEKPADVLCKMSEAIQQKMSRLKQL